jgi:hypothetical protein
MRSLLKVTLHRAGWQAFKASTASKIILAQVLRRFFNGLPVLTRF